MTLMRRGCPPWAPRLDACDVAVLHGHDIPFVGTYGEAGTTGRVLFVCLDGHVDEISLWAYVRLVDIEDPTQRQFADVDELMNWAQRCAVTHAAAVSAAVDAAIIAWADVEPGQTISQAFEMLTNGLVQDTRQVGSLVGDLIGDLTGEGNSDIPVIQQQRDTFSTC